MLGAPQVGFSAATREIKARSSGLTGGLPPTRPARDRYPQYSRKPARCHATMLLGVTSTREWFHHGQSHKREIQKNLCTLDSGRLRTFRVQSQQLLAKS